VACFVFHTGKKEKNNPTGKRKKQAAKAAPFLLILFTGDLHPCRWRASVVHSAEQYIVSLCPALMHSLHWNFAIASSAQCLKAKHQDKTKEHKANTPRASAFGNQNAFFLPAPTGSAARVRAVPEVSPDSFVRHIPRLVLTERATGIVDIKNMKHPRPATPLLQRVPPKQKQRTRRGLTRRHIRR
jgi:hypothetical protein